MKKISLLLLIAFIALNCPAQQPEDTEDWSRRPEVVTPGEGTQPPSDAILLYGGSDDLDNWVCRDGSPARWDAGEILTVAPGTDDIRTKQPFGDVQLHVEWAAPVPARGTRLVRATAGSGTVVKVVSGDK